MMKFIDWGFDTFGPFFLTLPFWIWLLAAYIHARVTKKSTFF